MWVLFRALVYVVQSGGGGVAWGVGVASGSGRDGGRRRRKCVLTAEGWAGAGGAGVEVGWRTCVCGSGMRWRRFAADAWKRHRVGEPRPLRTGGRNGDEAGELEVAQLKLSENYCMWPRAKQATGCC